MEVLEEIIDSGNSRKEILKVGKKKYTRFTSVRGIEWRRYKTNHQVKQVVFDSLEKRYGEKFPLHFVPSGFIEQINDKTFSVTWKVGETPVISNKKERGRIERQVISMAGGGSKLTAVKYVKEQTGWGLRESKDFVESVIEKKRIYNQPLERFYDIGKKELKKIKEQSFEIYKNKGSKLVAVKFIKDNTGFSLKDSKDIFDEYVNFKKAEKIVKRGF